MITQKLWSSILGFFSSIIGNNKAYDIQHDGGGNIIVTVDQILINCKNTLRSVRRSGLTIQVQPDITAILQLTLEKCILYLWPWGDQCVKVTPGGAQVWSVSFGNGSREIYRVYPNPVNGHSKPAHHRE